MARRKRQFVPFSPWEARKSDEKGYIRLAPTLMYSDAVRSLNHAAYRVYTYMKQHSIGKREFVFPHSRYKKFISKGAFQKAVGELVEVGLIDITENNAHRQKPNIYKFSDRWKSFTMKDDCTDEKT